MKSKSLCCISEFMINIVVVFFTENRSDLALISDPSLSNATCYAVEPLTGKF